MEPGFETVSSSLETLGLMSNDLASEVATAIDWRWAVMLGGARAPMAR
jgi:hypothetical protein